MGQQAIMAPPAGRRPPASGGPLGLALNRASDAPPLYLQIRDSVRAAVLSGALGEGMRLPPERDLAAALGVNRTTITRAYGELAADGVVEARSGRGTVVSAVTGRGGGVAGEQGVAAWASADADTAWLLGLPPVGRGGLGSDPGWLRDMTGLASRDNVISFAAGTPAPELVPVEQLLTTLTDALAQSGGAGLLYGPVEGHDALREAIATRLVGRGCAVASDEVLVLAGAMQGLSLVARALIEPGDEVVVEAPTFVGALQAFGAAGAWLIGVPTDEAGLRVDALERVLARRRVRLIYVQPTCHNPMGATLSPQRRERLVALARRHAVPILEDDAYGELWHEGPDPLPLKALDRGGLILHLGTFSKTVAPGLRVGWLAAPPPVIARLALAKQVSDLTTNALGQLALTSFLTSGDYDRHLATVRGAYAARRAAMVAALAPLAGWLSVSPSSQGGFYLWCRLAAGPHARLLAANASRVGVALLAGEAFYPPCTGGVAEGADYVRLSFAGNTPAVVGEGLERIAPILRRLPASASAIGVTRGLRPVV